MICQHKDIKTEPKINRFSIDLQFDGNHFYKLIGNAL